MPMPLTVIKVVSCKKDSNPSIEELSFRSVYESAHLQMQEKMLREILGGPFQVKPYPAQLRKPDLFVWGNAQSCLVGRKSSTGGPLSLLDPEIMLVVDDFHKYKIWFF